MTNPLLAQGLGRAAHCADGEYNILINQSIIAIIDDIIIITIATVTAIVVIIGLLAASP